jgi:hypothetical protein
MFVERRPDSPRLPIPAQASRVVPKTPIYAEAGACKRIHLSHPDLCKKIVQKARRAFSKLGRKPGSKTFHNSSGRLHQDSLSYTNSVQDIDACSNYSSRTATFELPAGDGAAYKLPEHRAMAYSGTLYEAPGISAACNEPQQTSFGGDGCNVSPVIPYHGFSSSGSSMSTWAQHPRQILSSSRYVSYAELPDPGSPARRLSELDGSSSTCSSFSVSTPTINPSHIQPVIGKEGLEMRVPMSAGIPDSPSLSFGTTSPHEPAFGQEQPPGDSFMDGMDFCTSPTSLLPQHEFPNEPMKNAPAKDFNQACWSTRQSILYEPTSHASSLENSINLAETCLDTPLLSSSRIDDSTFPGDCHVTISLCPCLGLPMRPDMHLSDLCAMARTNGSKSDLFVQGNHKTLARRIQSMFDLLVGLASERLERLIGCEPKLQSFLAPVLETRPDIRTGLNALHDLHTNQSLPPLYKLVSLVFMAFSVLMLTVHENELSQCTTELYHDIASWLDALAVPDEKLAFRTMLDVLWLPEASFRSASFGRRKFCPSTIPKHYSAQNFQPTALAGDYGLRTGMTARICQRYVDRKQMEVVLQTSLIVHTVIHHAAEYQHSLAPCSTDQKHLDDLPPQLKDSVMDDIIRPYMESSLRKEVKEIVMSTAPALYGGQFLSLDEVDMHLKSEVTKRHGYFGNFGNCTSKIFSAACCNATAMFAARKVAWLLRAFQGSANRMISQTWAEDISTLSTYTQRQSGGTTSSPADVFDSPEIKSVLNVVQAPENDTQSLFQVYISATGSPTPAQGISREEKVSQDSLALRCNLCPRIFDGKCRRDHLRRHLKSVHGKRFLMCKLCGRSFKYRTDNLTKHFRVVHPGHAPPSSSRHRK